MFFRPERNKIPEELQNQIGRFRKQIQILKDDGTDPGNLSEVEIDQLDFKELKMFVTYEVMCKKYLNDLNEHTTSEVIAEILKQADNLRILNPKNGFHGFINNRLTVIVGNLSMWNNLSLEEKKYTFRMLNNY